MDIAKILCKFPSANEGTTSRNLSAPEHRALSLAGMIGPLGGLTRSGSIAAQKAKRAEEDRLFPL